MKDALIKNEVYLSLRVGSLVDFWELPPGSFFSRDNKYFIKTSYTRYYEIGLEGSPGFAHRPVIVNDSMDGCKKLTISYKLDEGGVVVETDSLTVVE